MEPMICYIWLTIFWSKSFKFCVVQINQFHSNFTSFWFKHVRYYQQYLRLLMLATAMVTGGGGVLTLTWYMHVCMPSGALFREIWYSYRRFSSETKEPNLHELSVFWANYYENHAFLSKMVY